jgi:hypothetical protein
MARHLNLRKKRLLCFAKLAVLTYELAHTAPKKAAILWYY